MTHHFVILSTSPKFNVAIINQSEHSVVIINQSEQSTSYIFSIKGTVAVAKVSVSFDYSLGYKQPPELSANE